MNVFGVDSILEQVGRPERGQGELIWWLALGAALILTAIVGFWMNDAVQALGT